MTEEKKGNGQRVNEVRTDAIINLQTDIIEASMTQPVLVDFWAEWCAPCRVLGPILEKLADEPDSNWNLVKVNTDLQPNLAIEYGIMGIPAVKLFVNGKIVDTFVGALPENQVKQWLNKHLSGEVLAEANA